MKFSFFRRIRNILIKCFLYGYGRLHKTDKKILFSSFNGRQYSDNPRAICEKMHELYPEYKLVWVLNSVPNTYGIVPDYINIVSVGSFDYLKEFATAVCFVTNEVIPPFAYKKQNQYFVQTWHGDRKFKKILYEVWEERNKKRPIPLVDNKLTDLCIAGSLAGIDLYHQAFHYEGEILCKGCPRNDKLVFPSSENINAIKCRLNIPDETKILLFAPTYRDGKKDKQDVSFELDKVLEELEKKGDKWICLLRAHTSSLGLEVNGGTDNNYIDVTDYPDMADLLVITDFLISDYSSCVCDFTLTNKPVVLFQEDIDDYQTYARTLDVKPSDAGFIVAWNSEELIQIISDKTDEDYSKRDEIVNNFYEIRETGRSAEEVCHKIHEFVKPFFNEGG